MCIVIDTNVLACVFNRNDNLHREFQPVLDWIVEGKGKIVYGGSEYRQELAAAKRYFGLIVELKKIGKVVELEDAEVDRVSHELKQQVSHVDFDDPHIIAIVVVSKCRLLCTKDGRSFRFIKDSSLYPKGVSRPSIYTKCRNRSLLSDKYIADVCKPCSRITKTIKDQFGLQGSK